MPGHVVEHTGAYNIVPGDEIELDAATGKFLKIKPSPRNDSGAAGEQSKRRTTERLNSEYTSGIYRPLPPDSQFIPLRLSATTTLQLTLNHPLPRAGPPHNAKLSDRVMVRV